MTTSSAEEAVLSDLDPFAEETLADPAPVYRELRDLGPVVRLRSHPVCVITRYDDVRAALADWSSFSSAQGVALTDQMNQPMLGGVLATDPPRHDVLRSVLSEQLTPRALRGLRDDIEQRADALVAGAVAQGSFDAVSELCRPLPVDLVADLIGISPEGREHLLPGADATFATFGPLDARMEQRMPAFMAYLGYMNSFDDRSRLAPGSWGAAIWDAVDDGRLEASEANPLLMAYLVAGMDTTVAGLAAYIRFLAEDPDRFAAVKADPSLIPAGFEEALRLESPVFGFFRNTTCDVDVSGTTVPAGTRVLVSNYSANHDERKYAEPETFQLGRKPFDHLAFGYATHACAGQGLARLEANALIGALVRRVDRLELDGEPVRHEHPIVRSLDALPVSVVPAKGA